MKAEKYLFVSLQNFIANLNDNAENQKKYRDLLVFKKQIKEAIKSQKTLNTSTIEIYEYDIIFKQFAMQKIEIICKICNPNELLKLSEQQIIDWFFSKNVPLSEAYL